MILSDRYRFIFIHIPKCAGTSVREAVLPYHDAAGRLIEQHPELGDIDFRHLPLRLMRELEPEAFAKLDDYESYALLRDPYARFRSAMSQRAKMYVGREFAQLQEDDLRREIDTVIRYLRDEPHVIRSDYIHFARQCDFVEIDGTRKVRSLFPIERLEDFGAALAARIGIPELRFDQVNQTTVFRNPVLGHALAAGGAVMKQILPGPLYERMRQSARQRLMTAPVKTRLPVFDEPQVRDFVADYYARDIALHRALLADNA